MILTRVFHNARIKRAGVGLVWERTKTLDWLEDIYVLAWQGETGMIRITIKKGNVINEQMRDGYPILWLPVPNELQRKFTKAGFEQENLHITVLELGVVPSDEFLKFAKRLLSSVEIGEITLRGVEYFDNYHTVAHIGVDCPGLERVVKSLAEKAMNEDLEPRTYREFRPHITVRNYMGQDERLSEEETEKLEEIFRGKSWMPDKVIASGWGRSVSLGF